MENVEDQIKYYLSNQKFMKEVPNFTHKVYFKSKVCGDVNELYLRIDSKGQVKDIGYLQAGCGLNITYLEHFCSLIYLKNVIDIDSQLKKTLDFISNTTHKKEHCKELFIKTISLISEKKN